jgi:hypothetical protein
MIVIGIILLLIAYLLPDLIPVPPGILHICYVLGWVAIVAGIVLWIFYALGRPLGPGVRGRRGMYF